MEKNLTSGSVLKSILFFSLPYLLSYFLQTLYGMADLFIIGQFEGVASTTAVSIGSQVMHMITVMIVGLAMGATVTIGRAVGAENKPRAARLIGNTVTLFMAGSVVLAAVLVGLVDPIVRIVSTPEQAVAGTRTYLIICFIGVPWQSGDAYDHCDDRGPCHGSNGHYWPGRGRREQTSCGAAHWQHSHAVYGRICGTGSCAGRACGPDRAHCLHTGAGRGGHSYLPDHLLYRRSMHHGV